MTHVRNLVREKIITLIEAQSPSFSVHDTRIFAYAGGDLPACGVSVLEEQSQPETQGPDRTIFRSTIFLVELVTATLSNPEDLTDANSVVVEKALSALRSDPEIDDAFLTNTEFEYSGEGDTPKIAAKMQYQVNYFTKENDPESFT